MILKLKLEIKQIIEELYHLDNVVVEEPKRGNADIAVPLFAIAKTLNKKMPELTEEIKDALKGISMIKSATFMNGFLNIDLNRAMFANEVIKTINKEKETYAQEASKGKTICIDYSAPNIAKSFSVGHLRSTMIGNALKNIYRKLGYNVVGINHLGDWGTQFGKMIVAYRLWGNKELVEQNPITELQKLYVKFHEESEQNPSLEDDARAVFKSLEDNDEDVLSLWKYFREESLKEFMMMYELLNVSFDSYDGEAFFNDKMEPIVQMIEEKNLLVEDDGAMIVRLDPLPPALIKRRDGATLYITRDLAALFYRKKTYDFDQVLYVVGNEQKLHFEQLKAVTNLMGYDFDIKHVNFGLVLRDGKKMSTRQGKVVKLYDVIQEAIKEAKNQILAKNPNLENQESVAKAVGIGAIIFNDLKNDRNLEVDFNLSQMLAFEGQTGPYLQYSSVRIASILKNQTVLDSFDSSIYEGDLYFQLIKDLAQFNQVLTKAAEQNGPHVVSRYLLQLSSNFNQFYGQHKIIVEDEVTKQANLNLIRAIRYVLNEGMRLLGMTALEEM